MELLLIYIGTVIGSLIIKVKNTLDMCKDIADRGYKVDLEILHSNEEVENESFFELTESHKYILLIPLYNLYKVLLNRLEYMCMFIDSKVADSDYIYKSLHQIFLSSIQALYVHIASLNIDEKDKYYTKVINVFNLWKNKYIKDNKREEKLNKKLNKVAKRKKKKFNKPKKIS